MKLLSTVVTAGLAFAVVGGLHPGRLEARPSKAWAAAKANMPADASLAIGVDFATLSKSSLFSSMFAVVLAQKPDAKAHYDQLKAECKFDPIAAVDSVVIATDADQSHGAIYISAPGLELKKITSCLESVASKDHVVAESIASTAGDTGTHPSKPPVTSKPAVKIKLTTKGAITELSLDGDTAYVGRLGGVYVVAFDASTREELDRWIGKGGVAKGALGPVAAKPDTGAMIWVASAITKELDLTAKVKAKLVYAFGTVGLAHGTVATELRVGFAQPDEATEAASQAKLAIAAAPTMMLSGGADKALKTSLDNALKTVTIAAHDQEMIVTSTMPEQDLVTLLGSLLAHAQQP